METVIAVIVIIAVIIVGMLLIHRLNAAHDERITAFHFSDAMPGIGRRRAKNRRAAGPAGSPDATTHREHREGGRG
ncbi:hypothetical protein ABZ746_00125 [Streptomyces sp. NPDC020096]